MGRFTHLRFINSKKLSNTQSMRFRKYVFWNFADQFGQCTRKKMRVGVCVYACVRASATLVAMAKDVIYFLLSARSRNMPVSSSRLLVHA